MASLGFLLWKRQGLGDDGTDDDGDYSDGLYGDTSSVGNWWWSPAGMAVRYVIVAFIFAVVLFYFIAGYMHACRRLRRGQAPLAYHRWMVRQRADSHPSRPRYPQYAEASSIGCQGYAMDMYPPPPPAYNPADAPPPVYKPREEQSKSLAEQRYANAPVSPTQGDGRAGEAAEVALPLSTSGRYWV